MKNDQILLRFTALAEKSSDNLFAKAMFDIAEAMKISLDTTSESAIDFFRERYPYIGSLSKKAEIKSKDSIIGCAWKGRDHATCVELQLNSAQRNDLICCFAFTTNLGRYGLDDHDDSATSQFFESELMRFRINTKEKAPAKITISWKPLIKSGSMEEDIIHFTIAYKKLGYTFKKRC